MKRPYGEKRMMFCLNRTATHSLTKRLIENEWAGSHGGTKARSLGGDQFVHFRHNLSLFHSVKFSLCLRAFVKDFFVLIVTKYWIHVTAHGG